MRSGVMCDMEPRGLFEFAKSTGCAVKGADVAQASQ